MRTYRFKDDGMNLKDLFDTFNHIEDTFRSYEVFDNWVIISIRNVIIQLNNKVGFRELECYVEQPNGSHMFKIASKYKTLRAISFARIEIYDIFTAVSEPKKELTHFFHLALNYLMMFEYIINYSYIACQPIESQFKQPLNIHCDGDGF